LLPFAQELVVRIKTFGGRFLGKCDNVWYEMNDDDARKKAIQGKIAI
jgi:hypothetical protein